MNIIAKLCVGLIIIFIAQSAGFIRAGHRTPPESRGAGNDSYTNSIEKWRADRLEEVNGEDGWTSLIGLFWLKEGRNKLGSDPSNNIVLPKTSSPRFAGVVHLEKGATRLEAARAAGITSDGKPVTDVPLRSDADGKPTTLKLGSLKLFVIQRGEKLGLRVKDNNHAARANFRGLQYFPIQTNFRIDAKFVAHKPPKLIPIVNVLGMIDNMTSPGVLVFEINGKTFSLDPVLEKGSSHLFIIFADKTNGSETYGAGRYLYADPPDSDGKVILDFNKAHNPSCAFTKFATCPLPPRQNRLVVRIEAGEKKYAGDEH